MAQALPPPPFDVRLMNMTATVLFLGFGVFALGAAVWWVMRNPAFAVGRIVVQGDLAHNSAATLREHVAPRLDGNFFTIDLERTREAFLSAPWVRSATVQREFPNRLRVVIQEHQAVAYWGPASDSTLLNPQGEVFEAEGGDEEDDLPRLQGPAADAPVVLAMYRRLEPVFAPLGMDVEELALSPRGGWRVRTDGDAVIELGGGTPEQVVARTQRFVRTVGEVAAKYGRKPDALEGADLRHTDGYAVRLRGVTTVTAEQAARAPQAPRARPAAHAAGRR
ncbi:cell division protein FtsQ/DivIB [Xylophilus sp.]|uniref:cell division protein FtsQ/DivIB n=1 Tax=Xylophilus sp. TaxID=2653893 RepID=UPI0013B82E15|nr:cell division protein FtsQ/DivIB [Xylophilus sp.]KAF1048951.1 MAG: Cell division protein FtsQ [Xylophilus sp.]